ncbi:MAG: hypothetical protein EA397_20485 [Deltaproteobacteria bacterium]|nr:MAG: hypothetical protein EA397_20485 [Deltaproteobacteria bacterium]
MSEGLFWELVQAWVSAFDPEIWTLPLVVTVLGVIVGSLAMFLSRRGQDEAEALAEGERLDLERRRDTVVEAVRALDVERDKLAPEDYERERRALLSHGAEAMRAQQEATLSETEPMSELKQALEKERERLGEDRYASIHKVLRGESVQSRAEAPWVGPKWQGAFWTLGAVGVLLALYLILRGIETPQTPMAAGPSPEARPAQPPAVLAAEEALRADPSDLQALNTMTDYSIRRQQWGDAARYSQRALQASPGDAEARTWAALLAFRGGDEAQALAALDTVLAEEPGFSMAHQYRGLIALRLGDVEVAIRSLEAAIETSDDNETRLGLRQVLAEARAMAATPSEPEITGTISLAEGLDPSGWGEGASVFVSVRAAEGPPMPLRAKKLPVGPFPLEFSLGAGDAPMRGGPLPERVIVVVKVDLDGNPMGDDPGAPKVVLEDVEPSGQPLRVVLDAG